MPFQYDFGVIGGDERQAYCAELLADKGYNVCTYALSRETALHQADSLKVAAEGSAVLLGPIPFTKNKKELLSFTDTKDLEITYFSSLLCEGQQLFFGCIPEQFKNDAADKGAACFDLMEDEELSLFNTIATAEGTIAEAITKSPLNLNKSKCLILGYGKCGRRLCSCLKGLSCEVTVCARKACARAEAKTAADHACEIKDLSAGLEDYNFIFNTIPKRMIDRSMLETMSEDVLILDISSAPGGVDFAAAKELKIEACLCPGLPGKYAPKSSARAIVETVLAKYKG